MNANPLELNLTDAVDRGLAGRHVDKAKVSAARSGDRAETPLTWVLVVSISVGALYVLISLGSLFTLIYQA
jgi:hypothetical protein